MPSLDVDLGLPRAAPDEVGLDANRLQLLSDTIAKRIASGHLAGAVIAIIRHGRVGWFDVLGMQDVQAGVPMRPDSIFRLYSMTKPIASVAAMTLVEQGRMLLSDPVSAWIPSFADQKVAHVKADGRGQPPEIDLVPVRHASTVRDLLRHTAGLQNDTLFESTRVKSMYRRAGLSSDRLPLAQWVDLLASMPLAYPPGTVFDYSYATMVLGRLMEVVSQRPLDQSIQEAVTGPMGMIDTAFQVSERDWGRIAEGAVDVAVRRRPTLSDVRTKPPQLSAAAGLVGTARDYLRFCAMLLSGGELDGVRVLSPATVSYMLSDHIADLRRDTTSSRVLLDGYGFGLGFAVRTALGRSGYPGTEGDAFWGGKAGTQFWVDPKRRLAALLLIQQPSEFTHCWHLMRQMVYASLMD